MPAQLTDDVVEDAFSDMLRQAILLAEVLHEKAVLLVAALPRRRREAVDIMVLRKTSCGRLFAWHSFLPISLFFSRCKLRRVDC